MAIRRHPLSTVEPPVRTGDWRSSATGATRGLGVSAFQRTAVVPSAGSVSQSWGIHPFSASLDRGKSTERQLFCAKSDICVIRPVLSVAMMGNLVLIGLVALLAAGYHAAPLLSLSAKRRREARALRGYLLRDVRAGRRSIDDAVVAEVLNWCDAVAETGRDLPLSAGRVGRY
jgi:hypothetical protein